VLGSQNKIGTYLLIYKLISEISASDKRSNSNSPKSLASTKQMSNKRKI